MKRCSSKGRFDVLGCALVLFQAGDSADRWVYFDSHETERGPELVLVASDGSESVLPAAEDDLLIAYLADGCFGGHAQLSIDRGDRNRVLVRFDLPRGTEFERALLRLELHQSNMPTGEPFDLGVYAVSGPWSESSTTWNDQPAYRGEPSATAAIGPEEGPVAIDVTALARGWAGGGTNHGLLLRVAEPLAMPAAAAPAPVNVNAKKAEAELARLYRWADSVHAAVAEAERTGRGVLVIVSAAFRPEELTEHERLLLSTCLSHPDVRRAVERGYVPVRARVSPNDVAIAAEAEEGQAPASPLAAHGLDLAATSPPALVVIRPGAAPQVAARMGTFDHGSVLRLLGTEPAPRAQPDASEDKYWSAAAAWGRGERESANELFEELAGDVAAPLWAAKARFRLAFPDLVGGYEAASAPRRGGDASELVRGGIDFLRASQLPDGSWPMGHPSYEEHREGISVLAALALLERGETEPVERGHTWLTAHVAARAPAALNSFTATYWLEYVLARHARGLASEQDVGAAVALLCGGQMENGAWSYSRAWGEAWTGGFGAWPATERGRAHGMNTSIALEVLTRARELGFDVPDAVLDAGRDAMLAMRVAPGCYTYTWPDPRNFEALDASIGRAPAAETALWRLEATPREDLASSVRAFVERRMTLHPPAKLTDSWVPPHGLSGYFHSFAYLHGTRAVLALDGESRDADLAALRADVLARVEADGTWMDTIGLGKPYATAMALLILGLTED